MDYKIVTVHGTFVDSSVLRGDEWWQKDSPFHDDVLRYLGTETEQVTWTPFPWSGANSLTERFAEADKLRGWMRDEKLPQSKVVHLCHSHGGNVFEYARRGLDKKMKEENAPRAITVGTPFLMEARVPQFDWILKLGRVGIYVAVALFLAAGILELDDEIERWLWGGVAAALGLGAFALFISRYLRFAADALWVDPPKPWSYFGLGIVILAAIEWMKREAEKSYPRDAEKNRANIKIYSAFDEAIAALPKVNKSELKLAKRATITGASTLLWAILLLLGAGFVMPALGVAPFELPFLRDFTALSENSEALPPEWIGIANRAADLLVLVVAALVLGAIFAASRITEGIVSLFNTAVTRVARDAALGKDSPLAVSLAGRISANHPLLYGQFEKEDTWKPMPHDFDKELNVLIREETVKTAEAIREMVAFGMFSSGFSTFEPIKKNISGKELVHTSYFRHEKFAAFIAYLLVHEHGFPPSKHFEEIAEDATLRAWYDEIRVAEEPSPAARGEAGARSDQTSP
ncbi:MAG: hypothetical protein AAFZ02_09410, partial [Pseudomonadota bacterium]